MCQSILSGAQKERTAPGDDDAESDDSSSSSSTNRNLPVHPTFATLKGPQGRGNIFIKNAINLSPATCELLFCITCLLKCMDKTLTEEEKDLPDTTTSKEQFSAVM